MLQKHHLRAQKGGVSFLEPLSFERMPNAYPMQIVQRLLGSLHIV